MRKLLLLISILFLSLFEIYSSDNYISDPVSVIFFEKRGPDNKETITIKNNLDEDIAYVSVRLFYVLEDGFEISSQDIIVNDIIMAGRSWRIIVDSFDQQMVFAYKHGVTERKKRYELFDVEYEVLRYEIKTGRRRIPDNAKIDYYQEKLLQGTSEAKNTADYKKNMEADTFLDSNIFNVENSSYTQKYDKPYQAYTTVTVNMRTMATTQSNIIKKLPAGSPLLVISSKQTNGYYKIIDIVTNKEGFIHKNYITSEEPDLFSDASLAVDKKSSAQYGNSVSVNKTKAKEAVSKTNLKMNKPAISNKSAVYICTGPKSEKYHLTPSCTGLNRCSRAIVGKTEASARSMGRTKCLKCYGR